MNSDIYRKYGFTLAMVLLWQLMEGVILVFLLEVLSVQSNIISTRGSWATMLIWFTFTLPQHSSESYSPCHNTHLNHIRPATMFIWITFALPLYNVHLNPIRPAITHLNLIHSATKTLIWITFALSQRSFESHSPCCSSEFKLFSSSSLVPQKNVDLILWPPQTHDLTEFESTQHL